jgi:hypothetical protein
MATSISPVASAITATITKPEATEAPRPELKSDHDKDNTAGATVSSPAQTTNTQGQTIGKLVHAVA